MEPVPVGTVVNYHGEHSPSWDQRYVITGHETVRPGVSDPEVNYPDGVAYTIWPEGMPRKFGLREHMISQVRRQSLEIAESQQRPHKIHVSAGDEYNGETYIWCECLTPEGEEPVHCYGSTDPHLFDALFDEGDYPKSETQGLENLLGWLREHGGIS